MNVGERLSAALERHRAGAHAEAEAEYRAVLAQEPENPDALHFLGMLSLQAGDLAGAERLIRRSLAAFPANASAHNNLGNLLATLGRPEEAAQEYIEAVRIDPTHVQAWTNCGVLLMRANAVEKAAEVLEQAIRYNPDNAEALHNLGVCLMRLERFDEAGDAFERCLETDSPVWANPFWRAQMLCLTGHPEMAAARLEKWLETHPGDPIAQHQLDAIRGTATPGCSPEYVRRMFDEFAETFDHALQNLDYRAPELIAASVARRAEQRGGLGEIADLGCGTGLCGPLVRQHCARLTGVDMSPRMLARAARRGVYDALLEGDLVEFLQGGAPARLDMAISADVLCYFGELGPVMAALANALKPGGALVATVERIDEDDGDDADDGPGYRIHTTGRYSHRESYLRAAAAQARLRLVAAEPTVLRTESSRDVQGLVFELERPADA